MPAEGFRDDQSLPIGSDHTAVCESHAVRAFGDFAAGVDDGESAGFEGFFNGVAAELLGGKEIKS
jgi:hypothetical protein